MAVRSDDHYFAAVYTCLSLLVVMLAVLLAYVVCSKRYRLNWFEKTLLEGGGEADHKAPATPPLPPPSLAAQQRPLPLPPPLQQTPLLQRQASVCHSDVSGDDSVPGTPNTPLGLSLGGLASPFAVEQGVALRFVQPQVSGAGATGARTKRTSMQAKLDHTKINAAMYQKQAARTPSLPEDMRGSLRFSLLYEPEPGVLQVRLMQATDLMAPGSGETADPYARLLLLPDTTVQLKSAVRENTLQPLFDEELTFDVTPAQLPGRVLQVLIYDSDRNSRHRCMGSVKLALDRIDLSEKITLWKGISACEEKDDQAELGDLMVSLGYLPSAERLTVVVLGARNLRPADDAKNSSDPYVKVCVLRAGKRIKKKKTSTRRATLEPVFDEALAFDVAKELLPTISLEFTVVHDNILGPNESLGRVLIGPESKGEQAEHYLDVQRSRPAVARWHGLVACHPTASFS